MKPVFCAVASRCFVLHLVVFAFGCNSPKNMQTAGSEAFPPAVVAFKPYASNPVFKATGEATWDKQIRERGYILHEQGIYKLWYTGYNGDDTVVKHLGYATSKDGIRWERYAGNPIFSDKWTEDVCVVKNAGTYHMFAEGRNDVAHALISSDGIRWQEEGGLALFTTDGRQIPGPYGTPTVWIENGIWYLFYERNDEAIWLAQSNDHLSWTNVQDEPVLRKGPGSYDRGAVAANQVVKYNGRYFMYYHASSDPMAAATAWSSNVAMSTDLVHWTKYPKNPIVAGDHSSPIVVWDGMAYRLYTMHPQVDLYLPEQAPHVTK